MAEARRYNKGKLKYGLIPSTALREIAKVYTLGAHKYTIYKDEQGKEILGKDISFAKSSNYEIVDSGDDNWRKGQLWTDVMESVKRHIQDWEDGSDLDELGTNPLANAAFGLNQLLDYYSSHPELDNRKNTYFDKKVALDLDGTIIDFSSAFCEYANIEKRNYNWYFTYEWKKLRDKLVKDKDFWMNMKPLVDPSTMTFEPCAYVTNRMIPTEWSEEWLEYNGFNCVKVYQANESKAEVLKNIGVDIFVDDSYSNFVDLNNNGVFCYLITREYNAKYAIGHRRINNLNEITKRR